MADDRAHAYLDDFVASLRAYPRTRDVLVWHLLTTTEGDHTVERRFGVTLRAEGHLPFALQRQVPAIVAVYEVNGNYSVQCCDTTTQVPADPDFLHRDFDRITQSLLIALEAQVLDDPGF